MNSIIHISRLLPILIRKRYGSEAVIFVNYQKISVPLMTQSATPRHWGWIYLPERSLFDPMNFGYTGKYVPLRKMYIPKENFLMYEYDYEQELREKQNEIDRLEMQLAECQREIRRLRNVCREYEEQHGPSN